MSDRLVVLVGSGASLHLDIASTSAVTARVLSGCDVFRHTLGSYYLDTPVGDRGYVEPIVSFLDQLVPLVRHYHGREPTYEDLAYVVSQARDSESGEYDNPVVEPFVESLIRSLPGLPSLGPRMRGRNASEMFNEAANYIADVAASCLRRNAYSHHTSCGCPLQALASRSEHVDIFTLNHDLAIEATLDTVGRDYSGGFRDSGSGTLVWDVDALANASDRIRVFKLHGSLDWYRLEAVRSGSRPQSVIAQVQGDPWSTRSIDGVEFSAADGRPLMLVGTFDKILAYNAEPFLSLHYCLALALRRGCRCVVAGYGFGDKGVNKRLVEWMHDKPDARLIIIHPDPIALKGSARGMLTGNWDDWERDGRLVIVRRRFEDADWSEVERHL